MQRNKIMASWSANHATGDVRADEGRAYSASNMSLKLIGFAAAALVATVAVLTVVGAALAQGERGAPQISTHIADEPHGPPMNVDDGWEESASDGYMSFEELPTPVLMEIMADINDVLRRRGVLTGYGDPTAAYAQRLAVEALALRAGEGGAGKLTAPDGARYRLVAVRRPQGDAPLEAAMLSGLSPASVDQLLLVVFRRDYQLERAVIAPVEVAKSLARANGEILALDDALWSADGVKDVTSLLVVASSAEI